MRCGYYTRIVSKESVVFSLDSLKRAKNGFEPLFEAERNGWKKIVAEKALL